MNLILMTDFVLEQRESHKGDVEDFADLICRYALFLKQPLELWMFVPCGENGEVINESYNNKQHVIIQHLEYAEAKERCLFEWFEIKEYAFKLLSIENKGDSVLFNNNNINGWHLASGLLTIENLVKYDLQLTQTAIKQLGL